MESNLLDLSYFSIILSFIKLKVFEKLIEWKTLLELGEEVNYNILNNSKFMNSLDFLIKKGHIIKLVEKTEKYKNSHTHFLKSSNNSVINFYLMTEISFFKFFNVSKIFSKLNDSDNDYYENIYKSETDKLNFSKTMSIIQKPTFFEIVEKIDFSKFNVVVDIGGSLGTFCSIIKNKYPSTNCFVFDLHHLKNHIEKGINFIEGNFFENDFPPADVIIMSGILSDWNKEIKLLLLNKAFKSINENGYLIVVEKFIERNSIKNGIIDSYNMIVELNIGFHFEKKEFIEYCLEVGFKENNITFLSDFDIKKGALIKK